MVTNDDTMFHSPSINLSIIHPFHQLYTLTPLRCRSVLGIELYNVCNVINALVDGIDSCVSLEPLSHVIKAVFL